MPIDPKQLLDFARKTVSPNVPEADLRRGISTAYYSLFHFLIKEAMSNFVEDVQLRSKVARAFQHGSMRSVCERYSPKNPDPRTGSYVVPESQGFPSQVIATEVRLIAATFTALHEARERSEYDDAATIQYSEAQDAVERVEQAFQAWLTVQAEASAVNFLQELLCRSIIKR